MKLLGGAAQHARAIAKLTAVSLWRGFVSFYRSDNLTYAASIAYYALLSLFPFLLLVMSMLGSVTADENDRIAVLSFVFRYFPTQLDFITKQLDAFRSNHIPMFTRIETTNRNATLVRAFLNHSICGVITLHSTIR